MTSESVDVSRGQDESRGEVDNKLRLNMTNRTLPRTDMLTDQGKKWIDERMNCNIIIIMSLR